MFCHNNKAFLFFACQKDAPRAVLKKAALALGYGQQKYWLPLYPKSGSSGSATLVLNH